jgi:hypothetical protein
MVNNIHLNGEARAWLKRKNSPDEVVQIVLDTENTAPVISYQLYTAYEASPDYLGRILFDTNGYWIYDGNTLTVTEQEQLAKFIINYREVF